MNNWFSKFMLGRYGGDQLSMFLVIISVVLALIGQFAKIPLLAFISYLPLGAAIFRMLSKNTAKRSMENYKFFMLMGPIYRWYNQFQSRMREIKTHRYYKCSNCQVTLRVPKGRGKLLITCPKCKTKFTKET